MSRRDNFYYTPDQADQDRMTHLQNEQLFLRNKETRAKNKLLPEGHEQEELEEYMDYNDPARTYNWSIFLINEKMQEEHQAIIDRTEEANKIARANNYEEEEEEEYEGDSPYIKTLEVGEEINPSDVRPPFRLVF